MSDGRIVVDHLSKHYKAVKAVDDLSFVVESGRVTGFLGPNGAGKTTTLRMLLNLVTPTAGTATIGGSRYADLDEPIRRVGGILEASAAHKARTGRNHLRIICRAAGIPLERADEVLALVGLTEAANRKFKGYSLGMRQRLGIAAAMLGDPRVLILDEPANGLDPEGIRWIRNLLRSLADEGRTILVSSHLMSEMSMMADWLIVVGRGRLIADSTVEGFVQLAAGDAVRVRTPDIARLRLLAGALEGVTVKEDLVGDSSALTLQGISCEAVGELAAANRIVLHELSPEQASLEEAFMRLTMDSVEYHAAPTTNEASVGAAR
jgi:ABC-2 type transport system ATP-binding protein